MGNLIFAITACMSGIGFAFYRGPVFAACCLAYVPVFALILSTLGIVVKKAMIDRVEAVKGLGGVAAETFSAIKVIVAFGGEEIEINKMGKWIQFTEKVSKRQLFIFGTMLSIMKMSVFMYYTYSFFLGGIFVQKQKVNSKTGQPYNAEDVLAILIAFITGFVSLVGALPNV
jgi:ATP-binding cassette, subfamily B (MDR/TAP), member 1